MDVLGIDIGGTGIKGAIVDTISGELKSERLRIETPQPATPKGIADCVKQLVKLHNWNGLIGCGFPATIKNGIVRTATNIDKKWLGTDAAKIFSDATGCTSYVLNDADAAGLIEMRTGAGKFQKGTTIMITVGTGIGTALFFDGILVPNTELGHVYLGKKTGEQLASAKTKEEEELTWKDWSDRFNKYLNHLEFLFRPDLIIIGGGISKKDFKFMDLLKTECPLVTATYKNNAGIMGAAVFAAQQSEKKQ